MPRALGLAAASKYYRQLNDETVQHGYSVSGNEVVFATIGDASTSEGHFWETLNAAGVMQVPLVISVWDDGYGISVLSYKQQREASQKYVPAFMLMKMARASTFTLLKDGIIPPW
jgi:TPP-dependent pyruvate/acetoin dehydrogenase alpha subunit